MWGCCASPDSGFAYLTTLGSYAAGSPVDAGWFDGFLLIAVAACAAADPDEDGDEDTADAPGERRSLESIRRAALPYLPAGLGLAVALTGQFTGRGDHLTLAAATVIIVALLGHQLLTLVDNRALVRQLLTAQDELRHQAFHDPLTGLANRVLFTDRLRDSLDRHRRDRRALSVLYCDLDAFKTINDTHGHDAGDVVLRSAADRLVAATRSGATTARIGGDEFAILLEDGGDPHEVAVRILAAFDQPVSVAEHRIPLATSIGIAELSSSEATPTLETLLQRADLALYAAKRSGKGTSSTWSDRQIFAFAPEGVPGRI